MRIDEYLRCLTCPPETTKSNGNNTETKEPVTFGRPIDPGSRNTELHRYAFRLYMRGSTPEEVLLLTREYNSRLADPLEDAEIETLVNSACKKDPGKELDRAAYMRKAEVAVELAELSDPKAERNKTDASAVKCLDEIEEREPEWLIKGYIPKSEITVFAGDGGAGKTFVWCALAAAISSGKRPFILNNAFIEGVEQEPGKVLYFSSEDSTEAVLLPRIRGSGGNIKNIYTVDSAHEDFQKVKLNSGYLENLIKARKPELVIFDPLQSFLPRGTDMSARNQMREALSRLHVYGKEYGATFLIIMHTNKLQNVWGRSRLADSSDIWDIARSVLICGEAENKTHLRYISQEKSSYGELSQTVLFRIVGGTVEFAGYTEKRDRDFVRAASAKTKETPEREAAEQFIIEYLHEHGEVSAKELTAAAEDAFFKEHTLRNAKEQLQRSGKIRVSYQHAAEGKGRNVLYALTN